MAGGTHRIAGLTLSSCGVVPESAEKTPLCVGSVVTPELLPALLSPSKASRPPVTAVVQAGLPW